MKRQAKALLILFGLVLTIGALAAQKGKPWTDWNKKDVEKILNDSAWAQTQTETDTSEPTWSTGSRPITGVGAVNQNTSWNFRVRLLSAKPVRQAYLRILELGSPKVSDDVIQQARAFVDSKFEQTIVIAVNYDGNDNRFTNSVFQAFGSAITNTLRNNTYLDIKGGKRVFLQEYKAPNGFFGAQFIFPRIQDDKPVIDAKSGEMRFYAEFPQLSGNNPQVIINRRFKVSDFMYDGVLEF